MQNFGFYSPESENFPSSIRSKQGNWRNITGRLNAPIYKVLGFVLRRHASMWYNASNMTVCTWIMHGCSYFEPKPVATRLARLDTPAVKASRQL